MIARTVRWHPVLIVALAGALTGALTAQAEVEVKPIALSIGSPSIEQMDFSFRPSGINPGTGIYLLIGGFDRPVVLIDADRSTVSQANDSTGRDLLKEPPKPAGMMSVSFGSGPLGPFPSISEDGKRIIVQIVTPQAPAPEATSIEIDAKIAVQQASGTSELKSSAAPLAPGTKIKLGDETLEIKAIAPSDWEEGQFTLGVQMTEAFHKEMASLRVEDASGKALTDGPYSTMTMMNTVEQEMLLSSKPKEVVLIAEVYEGIESTEVPVKVTVGLGLD